MLLRMRIFITGVSGLLGLNMAIQLRDDHEVYGSYSAHPVRCDGIDALQVDFAAPGSMHEALARVRPDVVVHTAGFTNVDGCEADPQAAHTLNVEFAQRVARSVQSLGGKLVHISTDHLFDGTSPLRGETDTPAPMNVYARTKLQAEHAVLEACPGALVARTNFYGWGLPHRPSFTDWILDSLEKRKTLTMFTDVFYTPILINDFVEIVMQLLAQDASGVLHVAGAERLSKHAFSIKLAGVFGLSTDTIQEASIDDHDLRAPRPRDMSLDCSRVECLLQRKMPNVAEGLKRLHSLGARQWPRLLKLAVSS
jgi:dTDP-4-dehydrorhamnose reductase